MTGEPPRWQAATAQLVIPPELEPGVYANFASAWHTAYDFTLDFAVMMPPEPEDPEDADSPPRMRCQVQSRVRIPVGLIFDLLRMINENMTRYEEMFGEISPPRPLGEEET